MRTSLLLTLTLAAAILALSAHSLPIDTTSEKASVSSALSENNKEAAAAGSVNKAPASNSIDANAADAASSTDSTEQAGAQSFDLTTIAMLMNTLPPTPNVLMPVQDAIIVVQGVIDQAIAAVERTGIVTAAPPLDPVLVSRALWTLLTSEPGAATGGRPPPVGEEPQRPAGSDDASVSKAFLNNIKAGYGGPEAAFGQPGAVVSSFKTAIVGR